MTQNTKRPSVRLGAYTWRDPDGSTTPGIALRHNKHVAAHLTPAQAMQMADKLVDLAEQVERTHVRASAPRLVNANGLPEEPLPSTIAERE